MNLTWPVKIIIPPTDQLSGQKKFIKEEGVRKAPLSLALAIIELTDIVFASNILAILGFRALYFAILGFIMTPSELTLSNS